MSTLLAKKPEQESSTAWENDYLETKKIADYLTPIIESIRQPFVIALNSPYGTGKSFLIKNWKQAISEKRCSMKAVYFNAWATDYCENPLIALMATIQDEFPERAREYAKLASKGGAYIARKFLPLVAKGLVRKYLGDDVADTVLIDKSDLEELSSDLVKEGLARHKQVVSSVEAFKSALGKLVENLGGSEQQNGKLIIFIDELDRCKPSYAIEVLECIKHLFDVNGVVFILAMDSLQLQASIEKTYGTKDNGEGYLRKFIDWQINLPEPAKRKYVEMLYNVFDISNIQKLTENLSLNTGVQALKDSFTQSSLYFDCTLREMSQIYTDINLYLRSLNENDPIFCSALGFAAVMKHKMSKQSFAELCNSDWRNLLIFVKGFMIKAVPEYKNRPTRLLEAEQVLISMFMSKNLVAEAVSIRNSLEHSGAHMPSHSGYKEYNYIADALTYAAQSQLDNQEISIMEFVMGRLERQSLLVGTINR